MRAFVWQAHQLKNPNTATYKEAIRVAPFDEKGVCKSERVLLTGTPVQNNLMELHAVVCMACGDGLLGDRKEFKVSFSMVVEDGRSITASKKQVERSVRKSRHLQDVLSKYFLRRLKQDIFKDSLPEKREMVIWTHISDGQRKEYGRFLESREVVDLVNGNVKKSPLLQVTWLKSLVQHPILCKIRSDVESEEDIIVDNDGIERAIRNCSIDELVGNSGKLRVLRDLVTRLVRNDHKVLVFSTR